MANAHRRGKARRRAPMPVWALVAFHALALGIALVLYALPHHVIPRAEQAVGLTSSRESFALATAQPAAQTPTPLPTRAPTTAPDALPADAASEAANEETPEPEPTPVPTAEPVGSFRGRFPGKFTDGEVVRTQDSFRSANVCATFRQRFVDDLHSNVYVVDFYIADITCLASALARDKYGRGYTESIEDVSERTKALVAMNGDFYGSRTGGVVIRNGKLYRDQKVTRDVAVIYWDGRMETLSPKKFNARRAIKEGACQAWCFGPMLLDGNGKVLTEYNVEGTINSLHPRSAIGYFEPGHYCFVVVDGRSATSKGCKIRELARFMRSLGCKAAYNLDGGKTSQLTVAGEVVNNPSKGGRDSSDYIVLVDRVTH